jgi:hypothetical protein
MRIAITRVRSQKRNASERTGLFRVGSTIGALKGQTPSLEARFGAWAALFGREGVGIHTSPNGTVPAGTSGQTQGGPDVAGRTQANDGALRGLSARLLVACCVASGVPPACERG